MKAPSMYFDRINTDVLLANLFASGRRKYYTLGELSEYLEFLRSCSGMYLGSDFCDESVRLCADRYPTLFYYEDVEGAPVVHSRTAQPNLQFFNAPYSADMRDFIQRVTNYYVSTRSKT